MSAADVDAQIQQIHALLGWTMLCFLLYYCYIFNKTNKIHTRAIHSTITAMYFRTVRHMVFYPQITNYAFHHVQENARHLLPFSAQWKTCVHL